MMFCFHALPWKTNLEHYHHWDWWDFMLDRKGCWMAHCSSICSPAWTQNQLHSSLHPLSDTELENDPWGFLMHGHHLDFSELMPQRSQRIEESLIRALSKPLFHQCGMIWLTVRRTGVFLLSVWISKTLPIHTELFFSPALAFYCLCCSAHPTMTLSL